jgi:hypothetical protein
MMKDFPQIFGENVSRETSSPAVCGETLRWHFTGTSGHDRRLLACFSFVQQINYWRVKFVTQN